MEPPPSSGYEVLRIDFEDGEPVGFEPFVTGFLMEGEGPDGGWGHLGRLAGLAMGPDGALYLSDDTNGVIYRIAYAGDEQAEAGTLEPTNAEGAEIGVSGNGASPPPDSENSLAIEIQAPEGRPIDVVSPAFEDGASIPDTDAAEAQNISPPLDWAEGPEGTRSYVVMVEDADVPEDSPFVHWRVYNIPSDATDPREGVPGTPQLPLPEGGRQGANDHGSTGWIGMKPPRGDPAHGYHFQVFALDTTLDLPHGASRARLLEAMRGHVLSAGEVVGTYGR